MSSSPNGSSPSKRQRFNSSDSTNDNVIEVISSNTVNPLTDLPHMRHTCATFPFGKDSNIKHCSHCFCYVCDVKIQDCKLWSTHCDAHEGDDVWKAKRQSIRSRDAKSKLIKSGSRSQTIIEILSDSEDDEGDRNKIENPTNPDGNDKNRISTGHLNPYTTRTMHGDINVDTRLSKEDQPYVLYDDDILKPMLKESQDKEDKTATKKRSERITDVLEKNLKSALNDIKQRKSSNDICKMEGDIPQLNLANSFFVEGVRIGWPFPTVMTPQRQMALHIIKGLKNKRHVVLESP